MKLNYQKGTTVSMSENTNISFDLSQDMELGIGDKFTQFKIIYQVLHIHPVFIEVREIEDENE